MGRPLENYSLRSGDLSARYGGEEFIILLPNTSLEAACSVAETLRRTIEELQLNAGGQTVSFSASLGEATLYVHDDSQDPQALSQAFEQALLQAKSLGRNRVILQDLSRDLEEL